MGDYYRVVWKDVNLKKGQRTCRMRERQEAQHLFTALATSGYYSVAILWYRSFPNSVEKYRMEMLDEFHGKDLDYQMIKE